VIRSGRKRTPGAGARTRIVGLVRKLIGRSLALIP
jgi:hypothetical protein